MKTTSRRTFYLIAINDEYPLDVRYWALQKMAALKEQAADRKFYKRKAEMIGG